MKSNIIIIIAFLSIFAFGDEISEIKGKISAVDTQIDSLKNIEGKYVARLDAMDKKLALLNQILAKLSEQKNNLEKNIARLEDSLNVQKENWEFHRKHLSNTLKQMYISGQMGQLELAFLSDDMESFSEGLVYLENLAKVRNKHIESAQNAWNKYSTTLNKLLISKDSLKNVIALTDDNRNSLNKLREEHRNMLAQIRRDKESRLELLATLKQSLTEIEKKLRQKETGGLEFAKQKGNLPCPLEKCQTIKKFGMVKDTKYGTMFNNPGVDFAAKEGENVHSVADGIVSDVVWLPGYQYVVIIHHGGGYYSIYGNLKNVVVQKEEKIKSGQLVGMVGDSTWLENEPKLHFEIRHGKSKYNPLVWLR
ncbi:hypothetical protein DRQ33_04715 [bacterium]|nr:MAG: hypothetical protein DRQ33_04715 [bacterium]